MQFDHTGRKPRRPAGEPLGYVTLKDHKGVKRVNVTVYYRLWPRTSCYSGADLRRIRREKGVGRPPHVIRGQKVLREFWAAGGF